MAEAERLLNLLVEWEDRRQRGIVATAAELCPNDAELRAELERRIAKRLKFRVILDDTALTIPDTAAAGTSVPRIDGYEILDVIGAGGMGVVYKARQTKLQRTVALKMILSGPLAGASERKRFRVEAEAVARLQHPGIVQIFEIGEQDNHPYLALEYVAGGSLAERVQRSPLEPRHVAEMIRQLAHSIQHAHDQGVVHRDLKPANILLTETGAPKIADFGLAKRIDQDLGQTQTGSIIGSPSYMAPEQAEGRLSEIGPATDIYALGAILYEMLTGRPPFNGGTILQTLELVRTLDPVSPRSMQPGVPRDLETICLKCLEKRPTDRYASADALASDLENFLAGEPIVARPPSFREGVERMIRRGNFDPRFRAYAAWLMIGSPFPLAIHLIVVWLFRENEQYPVIITLTSFGVICALQAFLFIANAPTLRTIPSEQRRHFTTVWVTNTFGTLLVWLVVWIAAPPALLFLVYPLWMILVGQSYYAFAANAGTFYVTATVFSLASLAIVFVLPWMPVILGGIMFVNMMVHGILMRNGFGTLPLADRRA